MAKDKAEQAAAFKAAVHEHLRTLLKYSAVRRDAKGSPILCIVTSPQRQRVYFGLDAASKEDAAAFGAALGQLVSMAVSDDPRASSWREKSLRKFDEWAAKKK
jgi:hypothetical protein